jgi:hypothetical protein
MPRFGKGVRFDVHRTAKNCRGELGDEINECNDMERLCLEPDYIVDSATKRQLRLNLSLVAL